MTLGSVGILIVWRMGQEYIELIKWISGDGCKGSSLLTDPGRTKIQGRENLVDRLSANLGVESIPQ